MHLVKFNVLLPFFRQFEHSFPVPCPSFSVTVSVSWGDTVNTWCGALFWGKLRVAVGCAFGFLAFGLAINILNQKTYKFSDLPSQWREVSPLASG